MRCFCFLFFFVIAGWTFTAGTDVEMAEDFMCDMHLKKNHRFPSYRPYLYYFFPLPNEESVGKGSRVIDTSIARSWCVSFPACCRISRVVLAFRPSL